MILSEEYHSMIIRGLPMILICKLMIKMKKMRNVNKGRVKSREETHRLKYLVIINLHIKIIGSPRMIML
jgi:hypothetical protein